MIFLLFEIRVVLLAPDVAVHRQARLGEIYFLDRLEIGTNPLGSDLDFNRMYTCVNRRSLIGRTGSMAGAVFSINDSRLTSKVI